MGHVRLRYAACSHKSAYRREAEWPQSGTSSGPCLGIDHDLTSGFEEEQSGRRWQASKVVHLRTTSQLPMVETHIQPYLTRMDEDGFKFKKSTEKENAHLSTLH